MALSQEQLTAREGKLTASRVAALMNGDKEKILELWKELVGDPSFIADDLSDVWPVQLGETTEDLNLRWYEKKMQRQLTRRGEVVIHPTYEWAAATLDGYDTILGGPVETKHVGGWEKIDVVIQRYMPQIQWQMEVTQSPHCAISIIQGAAEPVIEIINYDKEYADEMMARANRFMVHVWNMEVPVVIDPPKIIAPSSRWREYNMTGNNEFAALAAEWVNNRGQAQRFNEAVTKLKEMMPHDASRAYGYLIDVKRAKNGNISIKPL